MEISADIEELCAMARVEVKSYWTFTTPSIPPPEIPKALRAEPPARPASFTVAEIEAPPPTRKAATSVVEERAPRRQAASVTWTPAPRNLSQNQRLTGMIVCSAAGGAGATTVAATLARILAKRSENIAVADNNPLPMVPFHFGAPSVVNGTWSLLPQRRQSAGAVHIFSRPEGASRSRDGLTWLRDSLGGFNLPWNRMLVDTSWSNLEDLAPNEFGNLKALIVATPNPSSALLVPLVLEEFASRNVEAFILLNRFEKAKPQHMALFSELSAMYGSAMLPTWIHENDLVPEALAEGQAITEYAPESDVAMDYLQVADWLQGLQSNPGGVL